MTDLDPRRRTKLSNTTCPYCPARLTAATRTEDHVIGRKFVPRGSLSGQWNLILWACEDCNRRKGELEGELSAITMAPDAFGQFPCDDAEFAAEFNRKGSARSTRTGRSIASSDEGLTARFNLSPQVSGEIGFVGPPQVGEQRINHLAWFHLAAFFYFITYDPEERIGHYWTGGFHPIMTSRRSDWGNVVQRDFMGHVWDWPMRVAMTAASETFKISIRRHPDHEVWSFALEWNRQFRIIGFLGDEAIARRTLDSFRRIDKRRIREPDGSTLNVWRETPLEVHDDTLFSYPEEAAAVA